MGTGIKRLQTVILGVLLGCSTDPASAPTMILKTADTEVVDTTAVTFVGAGDIAKCGSNTGDEETAKLLTSIPGTVYTLGDNVYDNATTVAYNDCYAPSWGKHKARTRPAPGNHEYNTSGALPYYTYFDTLAGPRGRGYYSYDLGAWHIVVLNSETHTTAQETWLRQDLAATTAKCVLAYWHHPLFTSGKHRPYTEMRNAFQILYDAGADVVLSAHNHQYERFAPQGPWGGSQPVTGIRQFVVGTGGAGTPYPFTTVARNSEVRYNGGYGVLKLTLSPDRYAWKFVSVPGKSFTDSGETACH